MFTGLEAQNRAREFSLKITIGSNTTKFQIAEALREVALRIDDSATPIAGLSGTFNVGEENSVGIFMFGKGIRD